MACRPRRILSVACCAEDGVFPVLVLTGGRGTHCPGSGRGEGQNLAWSWLGGGGTPVLGPDWGTPYPGQDQGMGTPSPARTRTEGAPLSHPGLGQGYPQVSPPKVDKLKTLPVHCTTYAGGNEAHTEKIGRATKTLG